MVTNEKPKAHRIKCLVDQCTGGAAIPLKRDVKHACHTFASMVGTMRFQCQVSVLIILISF